MRKRRIHILIAVTITLLMIGMSGFASAATREEWGDFYDQNPDFPATDRQCRELDEYAKEHDLPLDEAWKEMQEEGGYEEEPPIDEDWEEEAPPWLPAGITLKNKTVNIKDLSKEMQKSLEKVVEVWKNNKAPAPVITSGNDDVHKGVKHSENQAVDIRGKNVSDKTMKKLADDLQKTLGDDYDVVPEFYKDDPNTPQDETDIDHIHIEYDPKKR